MDLVALADAKIARLEAEIARLRAFRDTCGDLAAELTGGPAAAPAGPPPGKPSPRPVADGSGEERSAPVRLRIAWLLLARGPLRVGEMVTAGVGSQPTINAAVKDDPWFRKAGPKLFDPWELTEAGRAAASADTA